MFCYQKIESGSKTSYGCDDAVAGEVWLAPDRHAGTLDFTIVYTSRREVYTHVCV